MVLLRGAAAPFLLGLCLLGVPAIAPTNAHGAPPSFLRQFCEFGPAVGQCQLPRGIAADEETGNVYVVDQGNFRVNEFTAWGEFVRAWGWGVADGSPELQTCTTSCQQGLVGSGTGQFNFAQGIAVDADGDVYVVDKENLRVQKFDPSGATVQFELMVGGDVNKTKVEELGSTEAEQNLCTAASGDVCQAGSAGTGSGQFGTWPSYSSYIAVAPGPGGPIYVGDTGRIQEFNPNGTYEGDFPDPEGLLVGKTVQSLAVDPSTSALYLTFFTNENTSKEDVLKVSPAGKLITTLKVKNPMALATDVLGDLYVFDRNALSPFVLGPPILRFNPAGELVESFGKDEFDGSTGIATSSSAACGIDGTDLFVSNLFFAKSYVRLYGPPPDIELCPPPEAAPTIKSQHAVSVDTESAVVRTQINPHFWPDTSYYVQYGTADCKSSPSACEEQELFPGASLGAGIVDASKTTAGVVLSGLESDTTYFFRFVAVSEGGGPAFGEGSEACAADPGCGKSASFHTYPPSLKAKTDCPNQAFRTGLSAKLPDCRAYEMVSPLDKNNGDISTGGGTHEQGSSDGERATYSSFQAFGNPQGAPFASQYFSSRNPATGWSTRSISPPRSSVSFYPAGTNGIQYKAFSEDLCSGWLIHDVEVTLTPGMPPSVPNLYRAKLCEGGYELITTEPPPGFSYEIADSRYYPNIQGFSSDGKVSVFQADAALTPEANPEAGIFQLYELREGELHLISVLPNGEAASVHSSAGTDQGLPPDFHIDSLYHAVSEDASRIFWSGSATFQKEASLKEVGVNAPQPGKLYVRLNPGEEQSTSGACDEAAKACTIEISAAPTTQFWGADPEGKTALFTTGEFVAGTGTLREFDVESETAQPIAEGVKGVAGFSEDLARIYLISTKDLAAGATAGGSNLYLYEKGVGFRLVATLTAAETNQNNGLTVGSIKPSLRIARVSPDGLHAAFMSASAQLSEQVAGYDNTDLNNGQADAEVYLYDAAANGGAGELRCVSCNPSGARPQGANIGTGNSVLWAAAQIPGWESQLHPSRVLSADGSRLFFESFDALVLRDTNGKQDVYEWEQAADAKACEEAGADLFVEKAGGCISLISSGQSAEHSQFLDASASGSDVFFTTEASLLPQDFGLVDVYDARVNGGFPTPAESEAPLRRGGLPVPTRASRRSDPFELDLRGSRKPLAEQGQAALPQRQTFGAPQWHAALRGQAQEEARQTESAAAPQGGRTMRRRTILTLLLALAGSALSAGPASAAYGLKDLDVTFTGSDGSPAMQAGGHPFAMTTTVRFATKDDPELDFDVPDGSTKDLKIVQPPGFAGNPTALSRCSTLDFLNADCLPGSQAGVTDVTFGDPTFTLTFPVYNLTPPPGVAAKLGFDVVGVLITIEVGLSPDPPYSIVASLANVPQAVPAYGAVTTLWGVPADPAHDPERRGPGCPSGCSVDLPLKPFLTVPRSCTGPLATLFEANSWESPTVKVKEKAVTDDGIIGCSKLGFDPRITSQASTDRVESPSGLELSLDVDDEGLDNPTGIAKSDIQKAVISLPQGVTANPSLAEGLATCSPEDLERETLAAEAGDGCPEASKIGSLELETPLLEGKLIRGSLFIASQDDPATAAPGAENPFDSLLALYMVIKDRNLGILIELPGKIEPDPATGQLTTTFDDLPQLPFSHFRARLREGGRSPLITPPGCGIYTTKAVLTPWANPSSPLTTTASFEIDKGLGGGACPPAGTPPFLPGFIAGSTNNNAGSHSPFYMRLTRRDGDQDLTRFSALLPPGVVATLAGVDRCPEAAIAAAKAKTGREELASPSCPANSQIGRTLAGAGVGSQLTYAAGKLYMAGPFAGAPLSVVAVTPAVAGPFDVGTVVVRQALQIDPRTGEVRADGTRSDPIPHILAGIPLKVRDVRVYVDRPNFTLNPTSCDPFWTLAEIWGGGSDVFSTADDSPFSVADRFQVAGCANLGFKPKISLRLKGGTRRGSHPGLRTVVEPRPGDANLSGAVVRLPRSAFLEQGHIRTICTRVQFAANSCPAGAIYGHVRVLTPILDDPLEGPIYLRSSDNKLPDMVFDLHGLVDFEAVGRIDSVRGSIRATFTEVPDAPVSKVIATFPAGKKGLIVNSRDLCAHRSRANALFSGHNGMQRKLRPLMQVDCGKKKGN